LYFEVLVSKRKQLPFSDFRAPKANAMIVTPQHGISMNSTPMQLLEHLS
jgi:hypothetical protein